MPKSLAVNLLCDDCGMGKIFVAMAIARQCSRTLIVAPAALASMWRDALATTETIVDFLTFQGLSRATAVLGSGSDYDLVIVDEAHHAKNSATWRYGNLGSWRAKHGCCFSQLHLSTITPPRCSPCSRYCSARAHGH